MAHPLAEINAFTYNALNKELNLSEIEKKAFMEFLKAYLNDFWQGGHGSLLPPASGANSSVLDALFEKRFVYRNIIKECVERVARAFFGKNPNWRFSVKGKEIVEETDEEAQGVEDVNKALGEFWTKYNASEQLATAFESRLAFGRGGVRVYVPVKYKRENTVKPAGAGPDISPETSMEDQELAEDYVAFPTIEDAIAAMRVEFVGPEHSKLLDDGGEYFSLVKYQVRRNWETTEAVNVIEFSFVDNSDQTFVGKIDERGNTSSLDTANLSDPFDLGGLPTFNEFKGVPFVTGAMYKNNQLANLALTCSGFALVDNGFKELITTNVDLETREVTGLDGDIHHVPTGIKRGGGAFQNFVGIVEEDPATGKPTRLTPGVNYSEPVAMTSFKDGFDLAYRACLQEAGQLYALISGDAAVSGESRIQALADFIVKVGKYKSEIDRMGSWLMTTVLRWAAALAGVSEKYKDTVIVYDSRLYVSALSAPEKDTIMNMRKNGSISRETERILLGVDDPDLEAEMIADELATPPEKITVEEFSEKLDVALKMLGVNIDETTILKYLGFDDASIADVQKAAAEANAQLLETLRLQAEATAPPGGPGTPPAAGAGAGG